MIAGSANGEVFRAFVTTQMQPQHIRRQSMALLDNVAFHKSASTIKTLVEAGCNVLFTPPYSPEANPVENVFAEMKNSYRRWTTHNRVETDQVSFVDRIDGFVRQFMTGLRDKRGPMPLSKTFACSKKAALSWVV